jgi:hypothetical protein
MNLKRTIKHSIRILYNPEQEFEALNNRTLEEVVEDYIILLLSISVLAGVVSLAYQAIYAAYINLFQGIAINYLRLLNYSAGNSVSLFFFYAFAGTFLLFIISLVVKAFVKGIKYTKLISILLYSVTPLLLFCWITPAFFLPLSVWCIFLAVSGVKTFRRIEEQKKKLISSKAGLKKTRRK